jgi:hypothetical protein
MVFGAAMDSPEEWMNDESAVGFNNNQSRKKRGESQWKWNGHSVDGEGIVRRRGIIPIAFPTVNVYTDYG